MLPASQGGETMPDFEHVRYAVADGIATLTLHRPERLNAVNTAMLREIVAALDASDGDDDVRAVIVTGAGRAFCAGADLGEGGKTFDVDHHMGGPYGSPHTPPTRGATTSATRGAATSPTGGATTSATGGAMTSATGGATTSPTGGATTSATGGAMTSPPRGGATSPTRSDARKTPDEHEDGGGVVTLRVYDMNKPVIAAINGPAVGFGVTLTLPMDIRIASSAARLGFVFARRGVVPEACSTWFLPRLVGIARAAEWVYTGRVFDAEEARAGGLVSRVVAPDDLLPTARELGLEIARNTSAVSVALARHMLWKMLGADHPMDAHRLDSKAMAFTGRSPDAYEGVTAFLEKRSARFPLRPSVDMPPFFPWWAPRSFRMDG
jgi:enoyl-CoA hydratase/carnithine racemase